jgi:hypothetical protein
VIEDLERDYELLLALPCHPSDISNGTWTDDTFRNNTLSTYYLVEAMCQEGCGCWSLIRLRAAV